MIVIDRVKAESIVRDRLRTERTERLEELDVAYMRALENGNDTAGIITEKQALRDAPEKDLSALTIEDLATLTLDKVLGS